MTRLTWKRTIGIVGIVSGIGVAAAGLGAATAAADPGQVCQVPGQHTCSEAQQFATRPIDQRAYAQRGIDDGRRDHQAFIYNHQWVQPLFDPGRNAWGFWDFGTWIPL